MLRAAQKLGRVAQTCPQINEASEGANAVSGRTREVRLVKSSDRSDVDMTRGNEDRLPCSQLADVVFRLLNYGEEGTFRLVVSFI